MGKQAVVYVTGILNEQVKDRYDVRYDIGTEVMFPIANCCTTSGSELLAEALGVPNPRNSTDGIKVDFPKLQDAVLDEIRDADFDAITFRSNLMFLGGAGFDVWYYPNG